MSTTINSNKQGKVTDIICDDCHKLVPFSQPELSSDPSEVSIGSHACPPQILTDMQTDIQVQADAAAQTSTNTAAQV